MYITFILLLIVILLLAAERIKLYREIGNIPVRILVNGTRGKSSVVHLISALLRSNEIRTFSKITGVIPTMEDCDGKKEEIIRRGGARVTEQIKMIGIAAKMNSQAVVLECMSINPEHQRIESKILSPSLYVITNIREDHLESMGNTADERIAAICSAIPAGSVVITSEKDFLDEIKEHAALKNSRVLHTDEADIETGISIPSDMFPENLKIALLAARELKLGTGRFLSELGKLSSSDSAKDILINDFRVRFHNAFAVNDVPSAESFLKRINEENKDRDLIIIFNSRADRPLRSVRFAGWISGIGNLSKIILAGDHIPLTRREMIRAGIPERKIEVWNNSRARSAGFNLKKIIKADSCVIGIGNIKGAGFDIAASITQ